MPYPLKSGWPHIQSYSPIGKHTLLFSRPSPFFQQSCGGVGGIIVANGMIAPVAGMPRYGVMVCHPLSRVVELKRADMEKFTQRLQFVPHNRKGGFAVNVKARHLPGIFFVLLMLVTSSCNNGEKLSEKAAARLGQVDLKLDDATNYEYLKKQLLQPLQSISCYGDIRTSIVYSDCKETTWGSPGFISARFITVEGVLGEKRIGNSSYLYDIKINTHFKGTVCGKEIPEIINSGRACGYDISPEGSSTRVKSIMVHVLKD